MTKKRNARASRASRSADDYEVGYGRPPKWSQFPSGKSGNPKGRPKGAKNEATIWRNIFSRKVKIRDGGRVRNASLLEAMLLKYTERALNGETKAADFVLNRYHRAEGSAPETDEPNRDDQDVIDNFLRRLQAKSKNKTE